MSRKENNPDPVLEYLNEIGSKGAISTVEGVVGNRLIHVDVNGVSLSLTEVEERLHALGYARHSGWTNEGTYAPGPA